MSTLATSLPIALVEALAQLRRHPALRAVQDPIRLDNGSYLISVDVPVQLPSRAAVQGISATRVKAVEPLILVFRPDFPLSSPQPRLRVDFPLNMAHINVHRPGQHVSPCISEGTIDELFHQDGLTGVIEQTCDWLAKAASGQLLDLSQGWEPMRHDDCVGVVQFDAELAVDKLPTDGSILFASTRFASSKADRFFNADVAQASSAIAYFESTVGQRIQSGLTSALFVQAPWNGDQSVVNDQYHPDTVVDFATLLTQAAKLGINANLLRDKIESAFNQSRFVTQADWGDFRLAVILAVHRPVPLIGAMGRKVEFMPYLLHLKVDKSNAGNISDAAVGSAYHVHQLSAKLLAKTSGTPLEAIEQRVTFLGCGSLGSKVAFHLGRAGFGYCNFVDNQLFSPHNTARHALLLPQNTTHAEKAGRMKESFEAMGHLHTTNASSDDIVTLLSTPEGAAVFTELAKDSALVLDTTASMSVAQAAVLSSAFDTNGPRLARGMLYGKGRASVLMLEGPTRKPRIDDLEAALFAMCRANKTLREAIAAGDRAGREVFVGDNCRSLTMVMPDSVVSRNAAQIAMQVEQWLAHDLPSSGCLAVGYSEKDSISSQWDVMELDAPTVLDSTGELGWKIRVAATVARTISAESVHWGEKETGGVLLGKVNAFNKTIVIADLVPAPPDSVRESARFVLGIEGLRRACRESNVDSVGYLGYLGTWHSHPMGGPHSPRDVQTLDELAEMAVGEPRLSLVWTPSELICAVNRAEAMAE
ncbi:MAG: thiamine biosynthesis protein ThiF [Burkholderiales bacterium PBB3]|nr:MAG: thiamine biosynthesis protein ThiF [Burkholderiales bacterium PBB3]